MAFPLVDFLQLNIQVYHNFISGKTNIWIISHYNQKIHVQITHCYYFIMIRKVLKYKSLRQMFQKNQKPTNFCDDDPPEVIELKKCVLEEYEELHLIILNVVKV